MDEKYTPYNHKGTKIDGVEPKHRGTPAAKRGLSNQQVCIITAIQRFGHTIARTLNYGKPSSIDLLRFGESLESKSFVMLDGSNSYNELLESKNCTKKAKGRRFDSYLGRHIELKIALKSFDFNAFLYSLLIRIILLIFTFWLVRNCQF